MEYCPVEPSSIALGNASLDREHRGQIERMNQLGAALVGGRPRDEVAAKMEELISHLDAHFLSEQIAMREHAYPNYEQHVAEHDQASWLMRDLQRRFEAGDSSAAAEILEALRDWLLLHVKSADRTMVLHFADRGLPLP